MRWKVIGRFCLQEHSDFAFKSTTLVSGLWIDYRGLRVKVGDSFRVCCSTLRERQCWFTEEVGKSRWRKWEKEKSQGHWMVSAWVTGRIQVPLSKLGRFSRSRWRELSGYLSFWPVQLRWLLDTQHRYVACLWIGESGVQGRHHDWKYKSYLLLQMWPQISVHLYEDLLASQRPSFPAWFPWLCCLWDPACVLVTLSIHCGPNS